MNFWQTIFKKPEFKRASQLAAAALLLLFPAKIFFSYFKGIMPYLPPCPSIFLLRIYCPGCGSIRAIYCLFQGDIAGIFANNPAMPFFFTLAVLLYIKPEVSRYYRCINVMTVLLVIFTILRNLPWYPFTILAPAGI